VTRRAPTVLDKDGNPPTHRVTLAQIVELMAKLPDNIVFRWYQTSFIDGDGNPQMGDTYVVTLGQVRCELELLAAQEAACT
jgi:hypothetical protein